ncbi:CDP-glycerol glycerophosphotransferase family protein [Methanobrevibacter sp.]|uniref:CDP-glycerol glycerophosphotransferase family protein n=1 Tax=Methanobrevibacter sp. TaxID=66852 RepID=UPI002E7A9094|nr:CDP-glycerol glycerophosphotransferase family protein [Methanobrevibacter sp.]MEE0939180.1 CDP-glycerol glycerophosphotransferase family protein [Methanobrevibacter sp.]
MKELIIESIKNKILNHYFIINPKGDKLVFHLKQGIPFVKKNLMIKHRKTGKRILKEIKSSKVEVTKDDLLEFDELGVFEIYLQMNIQNKHFLFRTNFNLQNNNSILLDKTNQRIFDPYRNFNHNLSFNYKERNFIARTTDIKKNNNSIELTGEIELLEDLNFDAVEILINLGDSVRHYFPCEYKMEDGIIKFKSSIKLDIEDENRFNKTFRVNIRLKENDMILGRSFIKSSKIKSIKDKYIDYIENEHIVEDYEDYVLYFYFNQNFYLIFSVIPKNSIQKLYRDEKRQIEFYHEKSKKPIVFFESFLGKSYSGQPKYIYERMLELDLDKYYDFVWSYEGELTIPGNPLITQRTSIQFNDFLRKSEYWISNISIPILKRSDDIIYVQTTHGTPYKQMGSDIESQNKNVNRGRAPIEAKTWNYLITPNDFSRDVFTRAYEYEGEVINRGYPANDIFYRDCSDKKAKLLDELNIPKDKKIILYTPTFRDYDVDDDDNRNFSLLLDLKKLYDSLSDDCILIIRLHYIISKNLKLTDELKEFIIDLSDYDDIADLYLISDILITDYSSAFFDYGHSKKPILFFVPDFEEYSKFRGLYSEVKECLPGPELFTNDELIEAIKNIETVSEEYHDKYEEFYNKFCSLGHGTASDDVINTIFSEAMK